jgi:hypothetical protein
MPMTQKIAYLFLTDKDSEAAIQAFENIRSSIAPSGRAHVLFHHKLGDISPLLQKYTPFVFTDESLMKLRYIPIHTNIVPGSNHFPVLQFYLECPDFEYYWIIEDDVHFSGEWKYFFDFFNLCKHDFISAHLRSYSEEPEWFWWTALIHSTHSIPMDKRIRSFNPIYRISAKALQFIHNALINKWAGHHEVLLPTLLYYNQFRLLDFGGQGNFVPKNNNNRFYTSASDPKGDLNEGTMRYRPVWNEPGEEKNKLYHPVKP